ncbi:MAG: rod shape-determining protein MreD [Robiginitomaculum sp.]|nr:rod shape-determining protein MreD [Robiginitomaculum sp.]
MSARITPLSSVGARAGLLAWIGGPTLVSFVGLLIYVAPVHLLGVHIPMPLFPLMAIFFWAMARPQLMPPIIVFAIGLLQDLMTGGPLGLWAFSYLSAYMVMTLKSEMFAAHGDASLWVGFALMVGCTMVAAGLAGWLVFGSQVDWLYLIVQSFITVLVYPLAGRFYRRVQRSTQQARRLYDVHHGHRI